MSDLFNRLFDSSMLSPHGICLLWEPELVGLHVVSDAFTAISYLSIPAALIIVWRRRTDFELGWLAWLFTAFIVSCGLTHVLSIYTLWVPIYGIEGLVKAFTAAASIGTAVVLWWILPRLLIMPSTTQMKEVKVALVDQTQQRRNAEQLLQRFRDTEATEAQIRQAQKMEAIGQLTGGIAHDFNNLLTVITGSVDELATELKDRPHLKAIAEMIDNAASRGAALTNQLLAFARKQPLRPSPVDVDELIGRSVRMLSRTLGERIELQTALAKDLPPALVDEGQLETAILNLALNARDAMPLGGCITIETGYTDLTAPQTERYPDLDCGRYIVIALHDDGRGIAPEALSKVFEPFYTTKDVGKGTGLGLSMVYGFAKQSRGHIAIESELGRATRVSLFLPSAGSNEATVSTQHHAGRTALIIEDDPLYAGAIAQQLQRLGYDPVMVRNTDKALQRLGGQPIDVMVIGQMPAGASGHRLASEAQRMQPALKTLLASDSVESADDARADVNILFLPRPWRYADLEAAISRFSDLEPAALAATA